MKASVAKKLKVLEDYNGRIGELVAHRTTRPEPRVLLVRRALVEHGLHPVALGSDWKSREVYQLVTRPEACYWTHKRVAEILHGPFDFEV